LVWQNALFALPMPVDTATALVAHCISSPLCVVVFTLISAVIGMVCPVSSSLARCGIISTRQTYDHAIFTTQ